MRFFLRLVKHRRKNNVVVIFTQGSVAICYYAYGFPVNCGLFEAREGHRNAGRASITPSANAGASRC